MSGLFLKENVLLRPGFIKIQQIRKQRNEANECTFIKREKRNTANKIVKAKIDQVSILKEQRDLMNSRVNEYKKMRDKAVRRRDETDLQTLIDYYDGLQDHFHSMVNQFAIESEYYQTLMEDESDEITRIRDIANVFHKESISARFDADDIHKRLVSATEAIEEE